MKIKALIFWGVYFEGALQWRLTCSPGVATPTLSLVWDSDLRRVVECLSEYLPVGTADGNFLSADGEDAAAVFAHRLQVYDKAAVDLQKEAGRQLLDQVA